MLTKLTNTNRYYIYAKSTHYNIYIIHIWYNILIKLIRYYNTIYAKSTHQFKCWFRMIRQSQVEKIKVKIITSMLMRIK